MVILLSSSDIGDTKGAIADYDITIGLNPKHSYAYYNRGMAKEALGQPEAAQADFAKAKELDPSFKG